MTDIELKITALREEYFAAIDKEASSRDESNIVEKALQMFPEMNRHFSEPLGHDFPVPVHNRYGNTVRCFFYTYVWSDCPCPTDGVCGWWMRSRD